MKFPTQPTFSYRSFILLVLSLASSIAAGGCIGAARARVQANKPAPQQTLLSPLPLGIGADSLVRSSPTFFPKGEKRPQKLQLLAISMALASSFI